MDEKGKTYWMQYKDAGGSETDPATIWQAQIRVVLPLLELERCAFVAANHTQLFCLLDVKYWDRATGENRMFRRGDSDRPVDDPYDFSLEQLSKLPYLVKEIVLYNTYTYPRIFHLDDPWKARLVFDADILDRLSHMQRCDEEELDRLFAGHDAFVEHFSGGK